jgi:amino acid permease
VDDFLTQEKKATKNSALTTGNNRGTSRKSVAQSMRESIGYISTNKFGEGRRVQESGEVGQDRTSKQRQSEAIEKLGTFSAAASIFKAFVGLGILFMS